MASPLAENSNEYMFAWNQRPLTPYGIKSHPAGPSISINPPEPFVSASGRSSFYYSVCRSFGPPDPS
jgi:hypothetical protein